MLILLWNMIVSWVGKKEKKKKKRKRLLLFFDYIFRVICDMDGSALTEIDISYRLLLRLCI